MSRKEKLLSQLGPKFLGLHVRRGDQCQPEALARKNTTCFDLHDYMTLVKRIAAKYSISVIYLATDDEDVARKAPVYYPTFTWIEQSHNRQIYSVPEGFNKTDLIEEELFQHHDGVEAAVAVFTDLQVISRAAAFVGGVLQYHQ